jgi:hypothetical protein
LGEVFLRKIYNHLIFKAIKSLITRRINEKTGVYRSIAIVREENKKSVEHTLLHSGIPLNESRHVHTILMYSLNIVSACPVRNEKLPDFRAGRSANGM